MKKVVIIVPMYQETLTTAEKVSLRQLYAVLGQYPIVFMVPEKMQHSAFLKDKAFEVWPDKNLASRRGYSELLLEPSFYRRFQDYEYILIYQLDAFVFSDKLLDFCTMGYDYIGAPLPPFCLDTVRARVGNGGFSLRRVSSCIAMTSEREKIYQQTGKRELFEWGEDRFFAYCGQESDIPFSVPPISIAQDFSIESNVAHSWRKLMRGVYPFGCHGWSKPNYFSFWHLYMKDYVEDSFLERIYQELQKDKMVYCYDDMMDWSWPMLIKRFLERTMKQKTVLPIDRKYILWGYGVRGKTIEKLLHHMHCEVVYIFDRTKRDVSETVHLPISYPNEKIIETGQYRIVIGTTKYEKEIAEQLEKFGLRRYEDYLTYTDVIQAMIDGYFLPLWKKYRHGG